MNFDERLNALLKLCDEYMAAVRKRRDYEDLEHYIFEAALELRFGEEVWEEVNAKLR